MADGIIVINAGSTSLKFATYDCGEQDVMTELCRGEIADMKTAPHFAAKGLDGKLLDQQPQESSAIYPDGLDEAEVQRRRKEVGYNELPEHQENALLKFLSYFWGPIPWMIEVAIILSAVVQHWADFGIIMTLLVANAVVGFWEEHQAGNAIAALKANLALTAKVRRNGRWTSIPAREIVTGDLIRVRIGDIVPADAILREGDPIEVDQSALTGES